MCKQTTWSSTYKVCWELTFQMRQKRQRSRTWRNTKRKERKWLSKSCCGGNIEGSTDVDTKGFLGLAGRRGTRFFCACTTSLAFFVALHAVFVTLCAVKAFCATSRPWAWLSPYHGRAVNNVRLVVICRSSLAWWLIPMLLDLEDFVSSKSLQRPCRRLHVLSPNGAFPLFLEFVSSFATFELQGLDSLFASSEKATIATCLSTGVCHRRQ